MSVVEWVSVAKKCGRIRKGEKAVSYIYLVRGGSKVELVMEMRSVG